jgi:hypothetical protein
VGEVGSDGGTAAATQRVGLGILGVEYCVGCGWILIENRERFLCHFTSFLG